MERNPGPTKAPAYSQNLDQHPRPLVPLGYVVAGAVLLICSSSVALKGQNTISAPPHPNSLILPEANRPPDANEQMRMNQSQQKKENFDAANALREQQINDETVKLLILAKDLKAQMDKLGDKPLPNRLLREAEVIELLAHDVQTKMTLTVKGG
jgi:hypothetical protein